ncbi:MAG: hypothetical protein WB949_00300 [Candidatus Acidiferrales bacterium]
MATPVIEAPSPELRSKRQAMLVIHGIGEQNPYETLDSFARGVFTYLTTTRHYRARLCPIEIAHADWTQVGMRIDIFPPAPKLPPCPDKDEPPQFERQMEGDPKSLERLEPLAYVDLFEYYWAPITEDKLNAADTLKWLLKSDFTPLRHFADNLQEMLAVRELSWASSLWYAAKLYFRELARVIFLYLPLAAGVGAVLWWLAQEHTWSKVLKPFQKIFWADFTWPDGLALFLYLLFALLAWFGLQSLDELRSEPGKSVEIRSDGIWFVLNLALTAIFLAAALAVDLHWHGHVLLKLWQFVSAGRRWVPLAGALLATILTYALTAYVADVAVYVNMDAKSKNFVARNAILKGSTDALKMLLASDRYDRVILAGHSLGSVIAYDTINDLLAERSADSDAPPDQPTPYLELPQLQKLKGLVTFGSPLDKIYYFFREHVKRDQAIRAQILSMLHSFRRDSSGRDYGEFSFGYYLRQLDDQRDPIVWLNAWALVDPVSSELKFYFPDHQQKFPYAVPVLAHLSYWSDPNFYEYFCGRLL